MSEASAAVRAACTRSLVLHGVRSVRAWLERLAESPAAALPVDASGAGGAVELLERSMRELLGVEDALFFTKGVIAQQAALRIWTGGSRNPLVALHPKSHLELDEANALERLHPIVPVPVGASDAPFTASQLESAAEPFGAVTVELPIRRAGFLLTSWDDLSAISAYCRQKRIPLHLDGARAWEAAHAYGRELRELCAFADSTYLSFYKGLGGLAGCVLAGPHEFIAQARVWRKRLGGVLYANFPLALAALDGLAYHRPRIPLYAERAGRIAAALAGAGFTITPNPPQIASFRVDVPGGKTALERAHLRVAERTGTWFFDRAYATDRRGLSTVEIMTGEGALTISDAEIIGTLREMIAVAKSEDAHHLHSVRSGR